MNRIGGIFAGLAGASKYVIGAITGGYIGEKVAGPGSVTDTAADIAQKGVAVQSEAQAINGNIDNFFGGRNSLQNFTGYISGFLAFLAKLTGSTTLMKWSEDITSFNRDEREKIYRESRAINRGGLTTPSAGPDSAPPIPGYDTNAKGERIDSPRGGLGTTVAYVGGGALAGGAIAGGASLVSNAVKSRFAPTEAAKTMDKGMDMSKMAPPAAGIHAAGPAAKSGWSSSLRGVFKRSVAGTAILGGATFAGSMLGGSSTAEAAETAVKSSVPFADAAGKGAAGDTAGAAKSAVIEGAGIAGFVGGVAAATGTGAAIGATVGSAVPVAGTLVGGVVGGAVGLGTGIAASVGASYVAEKAWDGLSSLFNSKSGAETAPALAPAPARPIFDPPAPTYAFGS